MKVNHEKELVQEFDGYHRVNDLDGLELTFVGYEDVGNCGVRSGCEDMVLGLWGRLEFLR